MTGDDYRPFAKGQQCTVRLAPKCSEPSTTVFAHAPCRDKGTAYKSPHWWGAFACFMCHGILDGNIKLPLAEVTMDDKRAAWLRGIYETQKIIRLLENDEEQ